MEENIFFQKQSFCSLQCGLFSLNHLLGGRILSKEDMHEICLQLSDDIINPHKSIFGGDYDVNVLMIALDKQGYTTQWFDRRSTPLKISNISNGKQFVGFLVNIYSQGAPGFIHKIFGISKRHWLTIRRIKDKYYWIDSKTEGPKSYSQEQIERQLNGNLEANDNAEERTQILLVFRK